VPWIAGGLKVATYDTSTDSVATGDDPQASICLGQAAERAFELCRLAQLIHHRVPEEHYPEYSPFTVDLMEDVREELRHERERTRRVNAASTRRAGAARTRREIENRESQPSIRRYRRGMYRFVRSRVLPYERELAIAKMRLPRCRTFGPRLALCTGDCQLIAWRQSGAGRKLGL
jgi:hypothetical protein